MMNTKIENMIRFLNHITGKFITRHQNYKKIFEDLINSTTYHELEEKQQPI